MSVTNPQIISSHGSHHVFHFQVAIDLSVSGHGNAGQKITEPIAVSVENLTTRDPSTVVSTPDQRSFTSAGLPELYDQLLSASDRSKRVSEKTIRDNRSFLRRFEEWCQVVGLQTDEPPVKLLERRKILKDYAEHVRSQPKGNSASMCTKALGAVTKLSKACLNAGLIDCRPETVSKSAINVLRPRSEKQRRIKAVPVTVEEFRSMLAVLDGCQWPRMGKVSPSVFWETCLLSHYAYGFRSQDWFACRSSEKQGLKWSGVVDSVECPLVEGLENSAGWAWYLVHKTAKKDEAAERPSDVLVPLSEKMRLLIEQFRGIDPERVFPMRTNSHSYSQEFNGILQRSGLSDLERESAGKPIIRLSLGQRNVASFRKGCSALWARHVSRSASSYMLHHAVSEEGVSKTTTDSYLQREEILREITAQIELLPIW